MIDFFDSLFATPLYGKVIEHSSVNLRIEISSKCNLFLWHTKWSDFKYLFLKTADSVSSDDRSRLAEPVSRRGSQLSFASEASHPEEAKGRDENEHVSENAEDEHDYDEQGGKGKSKKKIKTILRKLQHSKKSKSSK